MRSRMLGGTTRPTAGGGAGCATAGGGTGVSTGGSATSTVSSTRSGEATSAAGGSGSSTTGSGDGASTGGGSGGTGTSATTGTAGRTVLTNRGGPKVGVVGLGGSTLLVTGPDFLPRAAGVSANMSPVGSVMPRWRASRSTNCRATTSSIVLEALFSSMPWSRFSSAITSWLVVLSSSATL
jgi:hypothetical protein